MRRPPSSAPGSRSSSASASSRTWRSGCTRAGWTTRRCARRTGRCALSCGAAVRAVLPGRGRGRAGHGRAVRVLEVHTTRAVAGWEAEVAQNLAARQPSAGNRGPSRGPGPRSTPTAQAGDGAAAAACAATCGWTKRAGRPAVGRVRPLRRDGRRGEVQPCGTTSVQWTAAAARLLRGVPRPRRGRGHLQRAGRGVRRPAGQHRYRGRVRAAGGVRRPCTSTGLARRAEGKPAPLSKLRTR